MEYRIGWKTFIFSRAFEVFVVTLVSCVFTYAAWRDRRALSFGLVLPLACFWALTIWVWFRAIRDWRIKRELEAAGVLVHPDETNTARAQVVERETPGPATLSRAKHALVGVLVGVCFGALIGAFGGSVALPLGLLATVAGGYEIPPEAKELTKFGFRGCMFYGGLAGAAVGVFLGTLVGVSVRTFSAVVRRTPLSPARGGALGALLGAAIACVEAAVALDRGNYVAPLLIHGAIVGWVVGMVAVVASPPWAEGVDPNRMQLAAVSERAVRDEARSDKSR